MEKKRVYSNGRMATLVVIFFLPLPFQYRKPVIVMYVSAAWVPLLIIFVSVKNSSPSVLCP